MSKVIKMSKKVTKSKKKKADPRLKMPKDIKTVQAIIMCGNIGTGKTTAAYQLVDAHGFYRISHDDILTMMRNYDYDKDDVLLYHEIENMITMACLRMRKDIIIDRTNMTRADRMRWIEFLKTCDYYGKHINVNIKVMDFGKGDEESLERVVKRETQKQIAKINDGVYNPHNIEQAVRSKWEPIYGFMYNGYEKPELDEGMYSIKYMDTGEIVEAMPEKGGLKDEDWMETDSNEKGSEDSSKDLD